MLASLIKILGAASLMGLVCRMVLVVSHALVASPLLANAAAVAIGVPAGAAAFYAVAAAFGVSELQETRDAVLEKLGRKLRGAG
jgi:hypothetical protein